MRRRCCALVVMAACVPVASAQSSTAFDVTTVKPSDPEKPGVRWNTDHNLAVISGITVQELVRNAYELRTPEQVLGGPDWIRTERFDISAKMDDAEYRRQAGLTGYESDRAYGALLQSLLKERFGLRVTRETRVMPRFALVSEGAKGLTPSRLDSEGNPVVDHRASVREGHWVISGITMENLAEILSGRVEVAQRVVVNQTGLTGRFDFKLDFAPDHGVGLPADAVEPGLADALRLQLGLRLKKEDGPVPVVVILDAKKPEFD